MAMKLARVLAVALVVGSCGYPKSGPVPPQPSDTAPAVAAGRATFTAKCNGCHSYPDVSAIADDRWPKIVTRMAGKAHLTPPQGDEVLQFILAARKDLGARN